MDGGKIMGIDAGFRAFGRIGEAWIHVDGVPTTNPQAGNPGMNNRLDYETFEEATIQTFGGSAESPTAGIQVNVIVKSGGNDFHGSAQAFQTADWMQGDNVDDALRAQGIRESPRYSARWDRRADLGGRIVGQGVVLWSLPETHRDVRHLRWVQGDRIGAAIQLADRWLAIPGRAEPTVYGRQRNRAADVQPKAHWVVPLAIFASDARRRHL